MIGNPLVAIQIVIGLIAMCFWAIGMYYWHLTNQNVRAGVSILVLLNPVAYLRDEHFSPAGLRYRKSAVVSFTAMMIFAIAAFAFRALNDALL